MIKLATVFSGIGSIEQALIRLGIKHEVCFACDNGDIELKVFDKQKQKQYEILKKRNKKSSKDPLNKSEQLQLETLESEELNIIQGFRDHTFSLNGKDAKRDYVESLYAKYAPGKKNLVQESYLANYKIDPKNFFQDIRLLDGRDFTNQIDLLVGGSPCQSFSTIGDQLGFEDTRGTLFYEFARIVKEVRPKVFIYENVNGLTTHDKGKTLKIILNVLSKDFHYKVSEPRVLNAAEYGIPQTRRRMFIIGIRDDIKAKEFEFPEPIELAYTMQDFLEDNCKEGHFLFDRKSGNLIVEKVKGTPNPKFNLTPGVQNYVIKPGTKSFRTSTETDLKIARTLVKTMTQHHRAGVDNYITVRKNPLLLRALTDRECLRLMGYPDSFKIVVPFTAIYRQAGNSIVVDVMMAVVRQILKTNVLKNRKALSNEHTQKN